MEELDEVILSKERKFDGVVIDVEHWKVRLPDGSEGLREIVLHKGAAAVIPVDEQGRVALVRQYRTPLERETLEIPAGKLDFPGEDPLECAKRELREETGLKAEEWRKLVALRTTPGFCNETIHMYMARGLSQGERDLDDDEFLNVEWMPIERVTNMILEGRIEDSKTIAAVLMAKEILNQQAWVRQSSRVPGGKERLYAHRRGDGGVEAFRQNSRRRTGGCGAGGYPSAVCVGAL